MFEASLLKSLHRVARDDFEEAGDEPIENLADLKECHSRLLMSGDPQRGAFSNCDLASTSSRFAPLPFRAQKPFLLEPDDVGERRCLISEISSNAFLPGR